MLQNRNLFYTLSAKNGFHWNSDFNIMVLKTFHLVAFTVLFIN